MILNYKYKIGDKVGYTESIREEKECPTCHHIEDVYRYEARQGEIEQRMYDFVFNVNNGFIEELEERDAEGRRVIVPKMWPIKLNEQVPLYKVGGNWRGEESLTPIK